MILLAEVHDLVDIDDLVNGLVKQFRPAQREMRQSLQALCRDIKKQLPDYITPPKNHWSFPADVIWDIKTLLETAWEQTEFLTPTSADATPVFVHQATALTVAENTSYARRQGLRFAAAHTFTDLKECITDHTDLFFRGVLIPTEGVRIHAYAFAASYRFWQKVWLTHGIAGLTTAYIIWRSYFEKMIDYHQVHQAKRLGTNEQVKDNEELANVLHLFSDAKRRESLQTRLVLAGKLCYRKDIPEQELSHAVQEQVVDYLSPTLWGALRTFGPEELRTKIDTTDLVTAAPQCLEDSELLSLILLFDQLPWSQIEQIIGTGLTTRTTVARILGSSIAMKRMATNPQVLGRNLQNAQNHGFVPDDLKATTVPYMYPDKTLAAIWRKAIALSD